jgi:hypothetical protein
MQAAKKGTINVVCGIVGQIITICLGIVIPRLVLISFGSEVNGLLNSVNQILVYFSLFEAGVGVAALQALYAPVATKDRDSIGHIMAATHLFYRKVGIVYAIAVFALGVLYPFCVKSDIPYWMIFGVIVFSGLGNCLNFLYQGKYKILLQAEGCSYVTTNITTLITVLTNVVKTVLLLLGFDVLVIQFSFFLINVLQMYVYYLYIHRHYDWLDLKVEPDNHAIEQKNATLIHQISGMVFNNTDVLLLTLLTQDLKIVSVYTMYNTIISMVNTMIQQVSVGFDFRLGQIYNTQKESYYKLHHVFEIAYLILVFGAMTVVYIVILPFMRLYTSGVQDINYIEKWYPLVFVMVPLLTYGRTAASNLINYAGHFRATQWRAVLETSINLIVSVVGIYHFGIYGALLGTIVAALYRTNDMIFYVYHHFLKESPWKTYKRWIGCFLLFGIVVKFVDNDAAFCTTYPRILLYACGWGICCVTAYTLIQILLNREEWSNFLVMIKDVWTRRNGNEPV